MVGGTGLCRFAYAEAGAERGIRIGDEETGSTGDVNIVPYWRSGYPSIDRTH